MAIEKLIVVTLLFPSAADILTAGIQVLTSSRANRNDPSMLAEGQFIIDRIVRINELLVLGCPWSYLGV
jgi:hypothetical protein